MFIIPNGSQLLPTKRTLNTFHVTTMLLFFILHKNQPNTICIVVRSFVTPQSFRATIDVVFLPNKFT